MRASGAPAHLLLFDHAFADDLVDGGFHERGGDDLAGAVALPVVGYGRGVRVEVPAELAYRLGEFVVPVVVVLAAGVLVFEVGPGGRVGRVSGGCATAEANSIGSRSTRSGAQSSHAPAPATRWLPRTGRPRRRRHGPVVTLRFPGRPPIRERPQGRDHCAGQDASDCASEPKTRTSTSALNELPHNSESRDTTVATGQVFRTAELGESNHR